MIVFSSSLFKSESKLFVLVIVSSACIAIPSSEYAVGSSLVSLVGVLVSLLAVSLKESPSDSCFTSPVELPPLHQFLHLLR